MKKIILLLVIFLQGISLSAQFPSDSYEKLDVTWFGIDYSQCNLVGSEGFSDPEKIVDTYFGVWNEFVETETKKYDVAKYLKKSDINFDLSVVEENNKAVDFNAIPHDDVHEIGESEIQQIISNHNYGDNSGLGVMLIAENYNKKKSQADYTFTIFDISSKQIKFKKRYTVKAAGFGFRNYWARTLYEALRKIEKDMKKWL